MKMITQEDLKELFTYNQDNGILFHKSGNRKVKPNQPAGYFHIESGYVKINLKSKNYRVHRLIWLYVYGYLPKNDIDHINHMRTDNRICNLREVSKCENLKNKTKNIKNTSGFNGVHFSNRIKKYVASIKINRKLIWLGNFVNYEDAVEARKTANIKYGFHENHGKNPSL